MTGQHPCRCWCICDTGKTRFWFFRATGCKLQNQRGEWEVHLDSAESHRSLWMSGPMMHVTSLLPGGFSTLCVSLVRGRVRGGWLGVWSRTGWLWRACPLKKSPCHYQKPFIQHLEKRGATLHSLINDYSSSLERELLSACAGLSFLFCVKHSLSPDQSQPKQGLVLI